MLCGCGQLTSCRTTTCRYNCLSTRVTIEVAKDSWFSDAISSAFTWLPRALYKKSSLGSFIELPVNVFSTMPPPLFTFLKTFHNHKQRNGEVPPTEPAS